MRLFVGIPLPEDVRARLGKLKGGLLGARWVRPENLHLSLRFIGEVPGGDEADIDEALATIEAPYHAEGTRLEVEATVEAVRHYVGATVVKTPFFNPSRKTATPPE